VKIILAVHLLLSRIVFDEEWRQQRGWVKVMCITVWCG